MTHILGYIALILNLLSMTRKQVMALRILSAIANGIYVIYGVILNAPPIIIGCSIAVTIHLYHIYKLRLNITKNKSKSERLC